jgi:Holliday junction resolvase RusA-like endonuclease
MPDAFAFRIPGPLLGWMRPERGKHGNIYDPPEQVAYKEMVALLCRTEMRKAGLFAPLKGPVSLSFNAVFPHPKKPKPQRFWKDSKPDLDNLIKNVKDALKWIAWYDDAQVAHYGPCAKCFMPPGMRGLGFAWVTIERPPDHDHPDLKAARSAGTLPGDAGVDGPEGQGRAGPHHQEGTVSGVGARPAQHPADGGL